MAAPPQKAFLSSLPSHLLLCHTSSIFSYISVTLSAALPANALTLPRRERRCGLILMPQIPAANTNMAESFVRAANQIARRGVLEVARAPRLPSPGDRMRAQPAHSRSKLPLASLPCSLRGTMDQRAVAPAGPASAEPPACTGRASQGRWSPCCRTRTRPPTPAAGSSPWTSPTTCRYPCSSRPTATAPRTTSQSPATRTPR